MPFSFASKISVSVMPSVENIRKITNLGLRYVELGPFEEHGSAQT
jgi:hypothetical protein